VIAGPPNVGKSRLFNALVGAERAIVTDIPGTTRDLVSETIDLRGLRVTLIDSAGVRETDDAIESVGVSRSRQAATVAALTLWVQDRSRPLADQANIFAEANIRGLIFVANKSDLQALWTRDDAVNVSAASGEGLDELVARMLDALDVDPVADLPEITNVRHGALVKRAHADLVRARDAILAAGGSMPEEFVLADLQSARAALEEVTGRRTPDDVLVHIFSRFCIGK
jgi:tRNA modification GTPase